VVQQLCHRHIERHAEVFAVRAGTGTDAPARVLFDLVEENGAAFEGVGHVGKFKSGVYGTVDRDKVIGDGRLLNKVTKAHMSKFRVSHYNWQHDGIGVLGRY
jgi:hypothetical protein